MSDTKAWVEPLITLPPVALRSSHSSAVKRPAQTGGNPCSLPMLACAWTRLLGSAISGNRALGQSIGPHHRTLCPNASVTKDVTRIP